MDLCGTERMVWTALTVLTAITAAVPWLRSLVDHGKLTVPPSGGRSTAAGWFNKGMPKRLFWHFYALGFVACALTAADILLFGGNLVTNKIQDRSVCTRIAAKSNRAQEMAAESITCLLLMMFQQGRRWWECFFTTRWGSSRMHVMGYAAGVAHYQLMLLLLLAEAPPLGDWVSEAGLAAKEWRYVLEFGLVAAQAIKLRHSLALSLFVVGNVRQHEALQHLASLRPAEPNAKAKINTYAMPTEGWFQYVSCPHYFAEILIYLSYVLLTGASSQGLRQGYLLALIWVFANQALIAGRAHVWYHRKFESYPRGRKRLVPGVW